MPEAPGFSTAIPASAAGLAAVSARLHAWLLAAGAGVAAIQRVELVLEEAVMNVIMHGTRADGRPAEIALRAALAADSCRLELTDNAAPFDPVAAPTRCTAASLEDTPGGLGLLLLRRYGQDLRYERLAGRNRLTVSVPLAG